MSQQSLREAAEKVLGIIRQHNLRIVLSAVEAQTKSILEAALAEDDWMPAGTFPEVPGDYWCAKGDDVVRLTLTRTNMASWRQYSQGRRWMGPLVGPPPPAPSSTPRSIPSPAEAARDQGHYPYPRGYDPQEDGMICLDDREQMLEVEKAARALYTDGGGALYPGGQLPTTEENLARHDALKIALLALDAQRATKPKRQWRQVTLDEECPKCGTSGPGAHIVFAQIAPPYYEDGDKVLCGHCQHEGWMDVDEDVCQIKWSDHDDAASREQLGIDS